MKRIGLLNFGFTGVWLLMLAFLFYLQIVKYGHFRSLALIQHKKKVELLPKRGDLYDASGRLLAASAHCYSAYVLPKYVKNKDKAARQLAQAGFGARPELVRKFDDKTFFWLKRKFDRGDKEKIEQLNIFGVFIEDDMKRIYPFGDMFAGMVGKVNSDNQGTEGLEYELNDLLKGEKGYRVFQKRPSGEGFPYHRYPSQEPKPGMGVYLTIDLDLQEILYEEIKNQVAKCEATTGLALALDPRTGEILAMVNISPGQPWRNIVITDEFEPGSTFKIVTAGAAINKGWKETDMIDARGGNIKYGGYTINDFRDYGILSFKETFGYSSNVGVVKISKTLDKKQFALLARNLGFGERTGIELPGEARGNFSVSNRTSNIRFANICFGQGTTTTVLQLAQAYAAIANGGQMYQPYIIKEIKKDDKTVMRTEPRMMRQAVPKELAARLVEIMRGVIDHGTGIKAKLDEVSIAGKTGTAQKAFNGEYSHDRITASFVGFLPASAPSLLVVIVLDEPKKGKWASDLCAPVFGRAARRIINLPKYNYRFYAKKP